jgi:NTE family protein
MSKEKQKLGLVLEGGGVKGAYQIGALMAVRELLVEFDGVVGTSIGAINGAIYLEGGYSKLFDVWNEIQTNTVFDLSDEETAALKGLDLKPAILRVMLEKKLGTFKMLESSYEKSQKFFETIVNEEDIRASGKDYGLVTFNISDMQPVEKMMDEIDEGKLVDYIIASATFPIFPPKIIDDKKYIDGGVYDNMPINLLVKNGYERWQQSDFNHG